MLPRAMGAFVSIFASIVRSYFKQPELVHPWGLPLPACTHKVLGKEFVDSFKQVIVIGDVHGCYDELMELLKISDTSGKDTLKLFVGDLVNKGPKSEEVLEFLMFNNATCHSVRGNHDEVVLREYLKSQDPNYMVPLHNVWMKNLDADKIHFLRELPYTMSLPSLKAVVVHAGLVPGKGVWGTSILDMLTMRDLVVEGDPWEGEGIRGCKKAVEGSVPWGSLWKGPPHVYFGHDAVRQLQRWPGCTGLDTGCVYGKQLTGIFLTGPCAGNLVSVRARGVHKNPG